MEMHFIFALFSIWLLTPLIQATHYKITDQVYFNVYHGDESLGRIVFGLFGDLTPKTVKNFITITKEGINGQTYAGTKFHRAVKKFLIQGGDIDQFDGSGSISIYGRYFEDEIVKLNHTGPGFLSMANFGKNTNGCQFFVTTMATPWLDGKHTIFGRVVEGQNIIHKIEYVKTDSDDRPITPVLVKECGVIETPSPFYVSDNPNDLRGWLKSSIVPLSMSFSIMGFFHWIIRKLDEIEKGKTDDNDEKDENLSEKKTK